MKGVVVRIERDRGFAFVRDEDGNSRFVHAKHFINPVDFDFLYEGQPVEFKPITLQVEEGGKKNGLRAIEVKTCLHSSDR